MKVQTEPHSSAVLTLYGILASSFFLELDRSFRKLAHEVMVISARSLRIPQID